MKLIKLQILALALGTIVNVFADPPEPEEGERWVRNDQYSDEFNGSQLNTDKWKNTFSGWKGRQPGYFDPAAVSVNGGDMVIRNHPGVPSGAPSGYTLSGGAVQSTTENSHFGYYECNFKASRVNMSTTFWLSSSSRDELRTADNNDSYSQELDICESIGGAGNFSSDFRTKMKFNTHYRNRQDPWPTAETFYSKGNNQVEIRDGDLVGGDASLQTSESWEDYHTYACNWRSAQDAQFFVDDRFIGVVTFRTDVVSDPFKDPMRINLVTETYYWAKPYPTDAELNNNNINVSYYNWVRTYVKLPVDQPSSIDDEGAAIFTEEVKFDVAYEANKASTAVYEFVLLYKANVDREMNIVIKDAANNVIKSTTSAALAGYGKKRYTVTLDSPLGEGNYSVTTELKNGTNIISSETKSLVIGEGTTTAVDFVNPTLAFFTSNQITFDVNYTAEIARDLVLVLSSPEGTWLGNNIVTVQPGTATQTIAINLATAPAAGDDYKVSATLRDVGGDWNTNVATKEILVKIMESIDCASAFVLNGCFENGDLSDWEQWGAGTRSAVTGADVYEGNYSLKVEGIGAAEQYIQNLKPNTSYTLSANVKVQGNEFVSLGVKEYDDASPEISTKIYNTEYIEETIDFTTGPTNTSAKVFYYSAKADGVGFADSFTLKENLVTGAYDYIDKNDVSVYPNPTKREVLLSTIADWTLFNLNGLVLKSGTGKVVSLEDFAQGVYWVSVGTNRYKIVKQ